MVQGDGRENSQVQLGTLRPAITRSKEEPEDQAQHGQQHHCDYPNQLLLVRSRTLENIDNCPDISNQYQEAQDTVVSEIHHFDSFYVQWELSIHDASYMRALTFKITDLARLYAQGRCIAELGARIHGLGCV
jgi:hypothetical protein